LRVEMKTYPDVDILPKNHLSQWKNRTLRELYPSNKIDVEAYSKETSRDPGTFGSTQMKALCT
jgi:hypothetical protein